MVAIPWIVPTLVTYGGIARPLAVLLFALLAVYLGSYHAAFAWLGGRLWRHGGWAPFLALPALWCVLEAVRSRLVSGFPWNLAGTAWIAVPGALPIASWIGVSGVSFLALLANAGVAHGVARRRIEPAAATSLAVLLALALGLRWAGPRPTREPGVQVRILQPATPILGGDDREAIAEARRRTIDMTREACDRAGALVVWPESAGWPYVLERDAAFRAEVEAEAARGCGVLLNSPRFDGDAVYNAAFLIEPGGAPEHYDKRHLVPFGEYVPLERVLPFVGTLARNAGGFAASDRATLLRFGGLALGMAICFEITFPDEVASTVRAGATALATVTNDAWYGDTAAPWQHLRAARFRAAENHRSVVRAALTGVSAWIEPDGRLASTLGVGERGMLRGELQPRRELTPFTRAPWAVPLACAVVCSLVFPFAILARRRSR
jgi:apolipoprotein N-acyltransferase